MGKSLVSCFLRHIVFTAVCWYHTCRGRYATSECCRLLTTVHSKVPWVVSSSRSSRWMQKNNSEAFSCRHFNFKTVLQSAHEHAIFIQKIEKNSPRRLWRLDPRAFGARLLPDLLYKILDIPLYTLPPAWCILSIINIAMIAETDQSMFVRRAPLIRSWKSCQFEFRPNCLVAVASWKHLQTHSN